MGVLFFVIVFLLKRYRLSMNNGNMNLNLGFFVVRLGWKGFLGNL